MLQHGCLPLRSSAPSQAVGAQNSHHPRAVHLFLYYFFATRWKGGWNLKVIGAAEFSFSCPSSSNFK